MTSKHAESTSMIFGDVEVVALTIDLDTLAAELARQPKKTLIALIDKIDAETADWSFIDSLEAWIRYKLSQDVQES